MFKKLFKFYFGLPKTALVGTIATVVDLGLLALMVHILGFTPQYANLPSLLAGSLVQFLGNRYYSFDGARVTAIHKQALGFFMAECVAFTLNALLFHIVVTYTAIHFSVARPFSAGLVFLGFSYPIWRVMFDRK